MNGLRPDQLDLAISLTLTSMDVRRVAATGPLGDLKFERFVEQRLISLDVHQSHRSDLRSHR